MLLVEFILNSQPEPPAAAWLYRTLLELYLSPHLDADGDLGTGPPSSQSRPSPPGTTPTAQGTADVDAYAANEVRDAENTADGATGGATKADVSSNVEQSPPQQTISPGRR